MALMAVPSCLHNCCCGLRDWHSFGNAKLHHFGILLAVKDFVCVPHTFGTVYVVLIRAVGLLLKVIYLSDIHTLFSHCLGNIDVGFFGFDRCSSEKPADFGIYSYAASERNRIIIRVCK
jgi:hypothetical protein